MGEVCQSLRLLLLAVPVDRLVKVRLDGNSESDIGVEEEGKPNKKLAIITAKDKSSGTSK